MTDHPLPSFVRHASPDAPISQAGRGLVGSLFVSGEQQVPARPRGAIGRCSQPDHSRPAPHFGGRSAGRRLAHRAGCVPPGQRGPMIPSRPMVQRAPWDAGQASRRASSTFTPVDPFCPFGSRDRRRRRRSDPGRTRHRRRRGRQPPRTRRSGKGASGQARQAVRHRVHGAVGLAVDLPHSELYAGRAAASDDRVRVDRPRERALGAAGPRVPRGPAGLRASVDRPRPRARRRACGEDAFEAGGQVRVPGAEDEGLAAPCADHARARAHAAAASGRSKRAPDRARVRVGSEPRPRVPERARRLRRRDGHLPLRLLQARGEARERQRGAKIPALRQRT